MAVGYPFGCGGRARGPKGRDPGEIVPASAVPLSPRACQPGVGRARRPSDARRPGAEITTPDSGGRGKAGVEHELIINGHCSSCKSALKR